MEQNISAMQKELLSQLQQENEELLYEWDETKGILSFARSDSLLKHPPRVTNRKDDRYELALNAFITTYAELFGPPDLLKQSKVLRRKNDHLGFTHLEYQEIAPNTPADKAHSRGGIEVYGGKLAAHFAPDGRLVEVQSSCYKDLKAENEVKVKPGSLQQPVLDKISELEGFKELQASMERRKEVLFPLMQKPRLVIYPWKGRMIYAWATYGFGELTPGEQEDEKETRSKIAFGQLFFDASSGELFLFAPTRKGAETPATGSGLGCIPLGGPYVSRNLNIVQVDGSNTHLLKNTTKARDIITYDANGNSSWVYPDIPSLLDDGTIPVSSDTDGDKNWDRVAADTTDPERTASQQPETDEHYWAQLLYEWYEALGGRVGWDDEQYAAPLVPDQLIRVVAHTFDSGAGTSRSVNAFFDKQLVNGSWVSHLAFFDGDPTGATNADIVDDYLAGSSAIVGHEYQHAITDFSFIDGMGNPGLTYSGWLAAVHEGLSDVFGGLFSADWRMGTNISPGGQVFRNLVFPRDPTSLVNDALNNHSKDHFDDRNADGGFRYDRGTILAHCAYLMAQGGVHQRSSRSPALIPVTGLGRETAGGVDVYSAARIWYRAIAHYLSNIGTASGLPADDENVFRSIRNACVSAAIDLYGANSRAHKTTALAWYAAGLHPTGTNYGADLTFLTWGANWWMSRPYIGVSSPDWSSVDLFINNGGASEWNAKINIMDGGTPTQFENQVYCRVRNVGDQSAANVQVQFEYAKAGTSNSAWLPMTDKDGNIQTLSLGALSAGQSNFPDSAQNTPPASAMVKWWIPPLETGETVGHFCMRARVFSISDVNEHNNEVQSNVAYVPYTPGGSFRAGFFAGNMFREEIPLELKITDTLPQGWKARLEDAVQGLRLRPGETRRLHVGITMTGQADQKLQAPFDGQIKGRLSGLMNETFTGNIQKVKLNDDQLTGQVAIQTSGGAHLAGTFSGSLDVHTGRFKGRVKGVSQSAETKGNKRVTVNAEGCLRPDRIINIGQYHKGQALGGVSFQVQVPLPKGSCFEELPPTDTTVLPETQPKPENGCAKPFEGHQLSGKVSRLLFDCFGCFTGFVIETCPCDEYAFSSTDPGIRQLLLEACAHHWKTTVVIGEEKSCIERIEINSCC